MRNDASKTRTQEGGLLQSKRKGTLSKSPVLFGRQYSPLGLGVMDFWRLE